MKKFQMNMPKGFNVSQLNIIVSQESDCCDGKSDDYQGLQVEFHDGGRGYFYTIKSERWAIDKGDKNLLNWLDEICQELDKLQEEQK
jgi:hypothetical protein